MTRTAIIAFALLAGIPPAEARQPVACIAPTSPGEAGKPLAEIGSLEFYVDEGNPLNSYGQEFRLVRSAKDGAGRIRNEYRVGPVDEVRGAIIFVGVTPVSFAVGPLKRTYVSLKRNDEETTSMADAVPGIVCYTVSAETGTF